MNGQRIMMGVAIIAGLLILVLTFFGEELGTRRQPPQVAAPPPPGLAQPQSPATPIGPAEPPTPPQFELVRISRTCNAIFAGTSMPGALVTVKTSAGGEIGRVTASQDGDWTLVPDLPLPQGDHEVSLEAEASSVSLQSDVVARFTVPDCRQQQTSSEVRLVVQLGFRPGQTKSFPPPLGDDDNAEPKGLSIRSFNYAEGGVLSLQGRSRERRIIQIYLNSEPRGSARVEPGGRWSITLADPVPPGLYTIRAEPVEEVKKTAGSIGLVRDRKLGPNFMGRVTVKPGMTAWEIAEAVYGDGALYPIILRANKLSDETGVQAGMTLLIPKRPARKKAG